MSSLSAQVPGGGHIERLTVDQYHRMIDSGILREGTPIELLDGVLVRKDRAKAGDDLMTVATEHTWAVQNLSDAFGDLGQHQCHLRLQQPMTIVPTDEPEPDGCIVVGHNRDYFKRHSTPDQVRWVIEVADSSLRHDRTTKQRIYASAGIAHFLIINLVENKVESYTNPEQEAGHYQAKTTLSRGDVLTFAINEGKATLEIPVERLLPPQP